MSKKYKLAITRVNGEYMARIYRAERFFFFFTDWRYEDYCLDKNEENAKLFGEGFIKNLKMDDDFGEKVYYYD